MRAIFGKTGRRVGVVAGLLVAVVGCNELIRSRLQTEIDKFWFDPVKRAETTDQLTAKLQTSLDAALDGKEFEVPGPNPYVNKVKWVKLDLGTQSAQISIPGTPAFSQTTTNYYLNFDWVADWAQGNGATVDMGLDLRSHSFWLGYDYPDHDVHVKNISAHAEGSAYVIMPKAGGASTASITVSSASVDLSADAEGWFWTFDVSNQVKSQVNDQVVRSLVAKSISVAFNAPALAP